MHEVSFMAIQSEIECGVANLFRNRWRSERNFWISVLAFVVWLVLNRFRSALYEAQKYRTALKDAERKRD